MARCVMVIKANFAKAIVIPFVPKSRLMYENFFCFDGAWTLDVVFKNGISSSKFYLA